MRIRNESKYATKVVEDLIKFACKGINMSKVLVLVYDYKGAYRGYAYRGAPKRFNPGHAKHVVRLHVGASDKFPTDNITTRTRWKLMPSSIFNGPEVRKKVTEQVPYGGCFSVKITMNDWMECLVAIAAHEAKHIYQFKNGKRCMEARAEKHALKRLEAFREAQAVKCAAHT